MPEEITEIVRLILADGTILENCECGYSNRSVWCYLKGVTFSEAFQYFSKPERFNTITLELEFGNVIHRITYSNIEHITGIQQDHNGINVSLEGFNIETKKERIVNEEINEEAVDECYEDIYHTS